MARYFLKMVYQGVNQADNMIVLICQMPKLRAPVRPGFRLNFSDQHGIGDMLSSFYLFGLLAELRICSRHEQLCIMKGSA